MITNILEVDLNHIIDHTRDLWDELRGEHLFITGGTGFFGCWLLESFIWANERLNLNSQVTVLTRNPINFIQKMPHLALARSVTLINGDVRSFSFPAGTFSHVIHAATDASAKLNKENPLTMLDTITQGTRHVLDFSIASGAKRFLFTSSGAIYGRQPANLTHIPENYPGAPNPLDPTSAYGQGKRLAEHLCILNNTSGMHTKIARGFAFVGPYLPLDIHFAIGNFIRDGLKGGPIVVEGDGTPYRSYLYAADLAIWLWIILFRGQPACAYNVGSDKEFSISRVAQCTAQAFSNKIELIIKGIPNLQKTPDRYVPDTDLAKRELGLDEWISLPSAIQRTIAWHMQTSSKTN